jgi:hypothetical protein
MRHHPREFRRKMQSWFAGVNRAHITRALFDPATMEDAIGQT